jgi:hypothetical protein
MNSFEGLSFLIVSINQGELLRFETFNRSNLDGQLDGRDEDTFENPWLKVFNALDGRSAEIDEQLCKQIDELREASYKAAYAAIDDGDFAAFVCDDFELIGRGIALGVSDPWLNGLWTAYKIGKFPTEKVAQTDGALRSILK